MAMRDTIEALVDGLASGDERRLSEAVILARELITKTMVPWRDPRRGLEFYAQELGEEYEGIVLTLEELELVCDALIRLVDGPLPIASAAASALHNSGRLDAIPTLADALQRWLPVDRVAVRQVIYAIPDIVGTNRPARGFRPDQERLIERGRAALRLAARAPEDKLSTAETAREALKSVARHLREARRWR